ncbi:MAG: hypothetical protein BroJett003_25390 [Planctomycetota bacterium]|nr:MAG: hypothetical protein BroJett003_25390 [Planctomycetota bacterium]
MDVVASFEVLSRDDNRRITEIEENFLDPGAADDYRTERVTFTYGDGDLDAGHLDADSATEVEHDKVYWDFLADLNSGLPLASSDPNRLVREHRTLIDEGYSGADAVTYDKRYYYDPNGNRLAGVEVDPEDEEVLRSVARYNYAYEGVLDGNGEERPPGVPDVTSPQWMDYAAHGRDQLMSTQTLFFEGDEGNTLDRVAVETFTYGGYGTPGGFYVAPHMLYRQRTTYRWDAKLGKGGRWWTQVVENTFYEYDSFSNPDRLQKQEYSYTVYDVPEEEQTLGDVLHEGAIGEFSGYDELLGRRIATWRCEAVDSTVIDWGPNGVCKAKSVMHDYYGLSQRVAAVRLSPWRYNGLSYDNVGDEFHESYTYGPVGLTTRTVETQDTDPSDNFDHWVLPDLFGGTSALLLYDAQPHERALATEHFDAFGVRVAKGSSWSLDHDASRYRWRSQEGSETDDLHRNDPDEGVFLSPPTLVYMQTRHYDPSLGRFIMADSIPMGAFSPQGLNRYAYCTNDPVNYSDARGTLPFLIGLIYMLAFVAGWGVGSSLAPPNAPFPVGAVQAGVENVTCAVVTIGVEKAITPVLWQAALSFLGESLAASLAAMGAGILGVFMLGVAVGYTVSALVCAEPAGNRSRNHGEDGGDSEFEGFLRKTSVCFAWPKPYRVYPTVVG